MIVNPRNEIFFKDFLPLDILLPIFSWAKFFAFAA